MNTAATSLLAHQGGWDELMLVALPLVIIAGLLMLANKRVSDKVDDTKKLDDTKKTETKRKDDPGHQ